MDRKMIYNRLADVFEDVFDEKIDLSDETTAEDINGWDSLTHISLLSAVEDEFDIRFDMRAVRSMKNVGEMVDMICELGEQ